MHQLTQKLKQTQTDDSEPPNVPTNKGVIKALQIVHSFLQIHSGYAEAYLTTVQKLQSVVELNITKANMKNITNFFKPKINPAY